jgi:hypothetical protein
MPQRKKKPSQQKQQDIAAAQHKNEFLRKLYLIFKAYGYPHLYYKLPELEKELMYKTRNNSLKPVAAEGHEIPAVLLKGMKYVASEILKQRYLPIIPDGEKFTADDYFTVGLSFRYFIEIIKDDLFSEAAELKRAFAAFPAHMDKIHPEACNYINEVNGYIGTLYSDLGSCLYWGKHELKPNLEGQTMLRNLLEIRCCVPDKIHITIDGNTRPVTRVGWGVPYYGMKWLSITPAALGFDIPFSELPLDVYIQAHALQRITERLDTVPTSVAHLHLCMSLFSVKTQKDLNGKILIEYRVANIKVGYLRADIVEGVILIRTFLFLTHAGTPESEKLKELFGIQKADAKYFSLDKLSTFMAADINENEEVKNIFIKAGFGRLFDLYKVISKETSFVQQHSPAMKMAEYIKMQENKDTDSAGMNGIPVNPAL